MYSAYMPCTLASVTEWATLYSLGVSVLLKPLRSRTAELYAFCTLMCTPLVALVCTCCRSCVEWCQLTEPLRSIGTDLVCIIMVEYIVAKASLCYFVGASLSPSAVFHSIVVTSTLEQKVGICSH